MGTADRLEERDGWLITSVIIESGQKWKAVRIHDLNAWQIAYGCKSVLCADSLGELELYLIAEKIKDDMIAVSANLATGLRNAAQPWRQS